MTTTIIPEWTLADRLIKARQSAHMTQHEFANATGLGVATIKRFEAGTHQPKRATLLGWAVACGVDPEWLEHGTDTGTVTTEYRHPLPIAA